MIRTLSFPCIRFLIAESIIKFVDKIFQFSYLLVRNLTLLSKHSNFLLLIFGNLLHGLFHRVVVGHNC